MDDLECPKCKQTSKKNWFLVVRPQGYKFHCKFCNTFKLDENWNVIDEGQLSFLATAG